MPTRTRRVVPAILFLALNTLGSGILATQAAFGQQWGFLRLEGVWAVVSAVGLARRLAHLTRES